MLVFLCLFVVLLILSNKPEAPAPNQHITVPCILGHISNISSHRKLHIMSLPQTLTL